MTAWSQKSLSFIPQILIKVLDNNAIILDKALKMKEYVKYLGVYIDADLSWKHNN